MGVEMVNPSQTIISNLTESQTNIKLTCSQKKRLRRKKKKKRQASKNNDFNLINQGNVANSTESKEKEKGKEHEKQSNSCKSNCVDRVAPVEKSLTNSSVPVESCGETRTLVCIEPVSSEPNVNPGLFVGIYPDSYLKLSRGKRIKQRTRKRKEEAARNAVKDTHASEVAGLNLTSIEERSVIIEKRSSSPSLPNTVLVKQQETGAKADTFLSGKKTSIGELFGCNNETSVSEIAGLELESKRKNSVTVAKTGVPDFGDMDLIKQQDANAVVNQDLPGTHGVNNAVERKSKRRRIKGKKKKSTACADGENANMEIEKAMEATATGECIGGIRMKGISASQKDDERIVKMEEVISSLSKCIVTKDSAAPEVACGEQKFLIESSLPVREFHGHSKRKLLVLDLNGILADVVQHHPSIFEGYTPDAKLQGKLVFKRPFVVNFLGFCFERFDVGIWSSRVEKNVNKMIDILMRYMEHKVLFRWSLSECTKTNFKTLENKNKPLVMKELRKLWDHLGHCHSCGKKKYDESNTLLVDDSPYKALHNPPHTGVFPYPYQYSCLEDSALSPGGDLRLYLEKVANAENVQKFVEENPFGQPAISESHPSWEFYSKIKRRQ